jgi:hypothetical protein
VRTLPTELAALERLGRHVFSRSRAKRLRRGRADHQAFLEADGVDELSVDRLDYAPLEVMQKIATEAGQSRDGEFQGWAVVTVEQAAQNGRSVEAKPLLDNRYHAEIVLNIAAYTERRDLQKQHATELATMATWLDRPN